MEFIKKKNNNFDKYENKILLEGLRYNRSQRQINKKKEVKEGFKDETEKKWKNSWQQPSRVSIQFSN